MKKMWLSAISGMIILGSLEDVSAVDDRALAIFQKSAHNISQMHSVQFSASISTKRWQASGTAREFHDSMAFTCANGRLRSEVQLTDRNTGKRLHYVSLFDGSRYQLFQETAGQLVVSNSLTTPGITLSHSPLELPYAFLSTGTPVCFDKLRTPSTWSDMAQYATYVGTESVDNHPCENVRLTFPVSAGLVAHWTVFFASDINYYPIKSVATVNDDDPRGLVEVRSYEIEHFPDGDCVLPTDVRYIRYSKQNKGEVAQEVEVVVQAESIKVNTHFDDDLFTIAASRAEWFHDVDADSHVHVGGKNASFSQDSRQRRRAIVGALLIAGAVVAVVAWILRKKRGLVRNG